MFHQDFLTHVGYCERPGHVNNGEVNNYQSVAAFGARDDSIPPFRIFDLDEPGVTFNAILLSLPLDLVCAQHLEGGPEAQLFVGTEGFQREFMGSYETDFFEDDSNQMVSRIPVVFGLRTRKPLIHSLE